MAGAYYNGQGGSIEVLPIIGSTAMQVFCVENWSLTWATAALDVTTTCSEGWRDLIGGISTMDATADSFYDPLLDQVGALTGLGLQAGNLVKLTFRLGASGDSLSGTFFIDSVTFKNPSAGVVGFSISAKSTGVCEFNKGP